MDILCDAVGSDLLLGSFLASSPHREQRTKRAKVDDESASSSTSPHVCLICKRVYERYGGDLVSRAIRHCPLILIVRRADHLTRHMRSRSF